MAEFLWVEKPAYGVCATCGSSDNARGFVDCMGQTSLLRGTEIAGDVDIVLCATCLEQAARMVGCASGEETTALTQRVIDAEEEAEKLKDEIAAHQQRFDNLMGSLTATAKKAVKA